MIELLKFLMRIAIRVLIVITIGAWGASRIYEVSVVSNYRGHELLASAEASGLSVQYGSRGIGWWPRLRIYVNPQLQSNSTGQWKIYPDGQGFVVPGNSERIVNALGIQFWRNQAAGMKIQANYLTLLITLVAFYALMRRRRRAVSTASLRSRLKAKMAEKRGKS